MVVLLKRCFTKAEKRNNLENTEKLWQSFYRDLIADHNARSLPKLKAEDFLRQAVDTLVDRASQRDSPETGERSMEATVKAFNAIYGTDLTESQGWCFMVLLKLVRGSKGAFRADDYIDASSYCALLGESHANVLNSNDKRRGVNIPEGVKERDCSNDKGHPFECAKQAYQQGSWEPS